MIACADNLSVLLVDPLNSDRGHPLDDDLFLSECIAPLASRFLVVTSPVSVANIRNKLPVPTREIVPFDHAARFTRPRLLRIVWGLPSRKFDHVIFQSFEEMSVLVFMLLHPRTRVHVIVTSNLRPDRLKRHPVVGTILLREVFRRAASVIVHCQHEVRKVRELVPGIDRGKVLVKPFHQMGLRRECRPWQEKARTILFLGPECPHKRISPVIDLIRCDSQRRYRYVLCGMRELAPGDRSFLESQENVDLHFGHVAGEQYFRLFSEAAFVILTHDSDYEGALSGAFCDAIACGTPVIARDMEPHSEYFERFGPLGFLVNYGDSAWCQRVLGADVAARSHDFQPSMAALRKACSMAANRAVFHEALHRV